MRTFVPDPLFYIIVSNTEKLSAFFLDYLLFISWLHNHQQPFSIKTRLNVKLIVEIRSKSCKVEPQTSTVCDEVSVDSEA